MFCKEGGHDHSATVMHAPGDIHLAHRGVYKRHACAALFPSQYCRILFIFVPRKPIPARFPILIQNMRRMMHQMIGELAPNNLFQKRLSAFFAILQCPQAGMPALIGADFSNRQVFRKTGGAQNSRYVSQLIIGSNVRLTKIGQTRLRCLFTQPHKRAHDRRPPLHRRSKRPA